MGFASLELLEVAAKILRFDRSYIICTEASEQTPVVILNCPLDDSIITAMSLSFLHQRCADGETLQREMSESEFTID
jgi:hypothetical protein